MTEVIGTEDLKVRINGALILDSVTFSVQKGDFFAIIGPNGAGKTTLIKAILGLIPIEAGKIRIFGEDITPHNRKRIGYVPQYHAFDFSFPIRVKEMVMSGRMGLKHNFLERYSSEDEEEAMAALDKLSALNLADRPVSDLSGGERQRALIARALAGDPQVLILDEPAVYVDAPTEEQFYDLLEHLSREVTILMITHDIGVISHHVTRIACLNRQIFVHEHDQLTAGMIAQAYGCPVDLITHGDVPHRVLARHGDERGR